MMTAGGSGRQFLLGRLPDISSNDNLWAEIIHDLFKKNDRIDHSYYPLHSRERFEQLKKDIKLRLSVFEIGAGR